MALQGNELYMKEVIIGGNWPDGSRTGEVIYRTQVYSTGSTRSATYRDCKIVGAVRGLGMPFQCFQLKKVLIQIS